MLYVRIFSVNRMKSLNIFDTVLWLMDRYLSLHSIPLIVPSYFLPDTAMQWRGMGACWMLGHVRQSTLGSMKEALQAKILFVQACIIRETALHRGRRWQWVGSRVKLACSLSVCVSEMTLGCPSCYIKYFILLNFVFFASILLHL